MFRKITNHIKIHKKASITIAVALVLLLAIGIPLGLKAKAAADAQARVDAYWAWEHEQCRAKSTKNDLNYTFAGYDAVDKAMRLSVGADVSTKETPEVYLDDVKVPTNKDTLQVEASDKCHNAGATYYEVSAHLPITCVEKKVTLKTSKYNLTEDISIDHSCKTKEQQEADKKAKAEAEAKKQAEEQRKKQEEADRKAKQQAANPYEKLGTEKVSDVRAYTHYMLTSTAKPSLDQVKQYMVDIQRKGCDGPSICNYFLWTNRAAYEANKSGVMSGAVSEVAAKNKSVLAGYVNSGYAFYYYGSTGGGVAGKMTIMDTDTGKYVEF